MENQTKIGNTSRKFTPLDQIKVAGLRTTLFWPLTLDRGLSKETRLDQKTFLKLHDEWLKGSAWQAVTDGLLHLPIQKDETKLHDLAVATAQTEAMADSYGEYVYFHDFVQKMLFAKTGGRDATGPLRLYQRTDIEQLKVDFGGETDQFDVERVNLYLLEYGVAVVAVQVATIPTAGLNLKSVLNINNSLRRSHIPHYFKKDNRILAGDVIESMTWVSGKSQTELFHPKNEGVTADGDAQIRTPYSSLLGQDSMDRRIVPLQQWRWLLNGADDQPERFPICKERDGYRWRHFSDDRFPILTTVILRDRTDYFRMTDGHWNRLAFVDPPSIDPNPYAEEFLKGKLEKHCYDRFHRKQGESDDAPLRYLMCDYAMTAVTCAKNNTFAPVLQMHMQRHYYQMFLLQVIDKAVMLGLSSRITQAVEHYSDVRMERDLSRTLQEIERDFLQYVHRFRFTGISGQLQAIELHAKLREVMGLDAMFNDIKGELETAVSFLSSRQSEHATEAAERLNIIASLGVVVALVLGFFSMNILTDKSSILNLVTNIPWSWPNPKIEQAFDVWMTFWAELFAFGLGLGAIAGIASWVSRMSLGRIGGANRRSRPAEGFVQKATPWLAGTGFALAILAACVLRSIAMS